MKLRSLILAILGLLPGPSPLCAAPPAPDEAAIAVSTTRLQTIHKALIAYEKEHKQWPDHLSDLVPDFLPDKEALRDPADAGSGSIGSDQAFTDPEFRVSYSYERNARISNGLAGPLGPFPPPDVGDMWGTWRHVNGHQEYFWGDQVPLVRCLLHRPAEAERADGHDLVLNLTPSGRVYRSGYHWQGEPDALEFMLRTFARDLRAGFANVRRHWTLWRVREYLDGNEAPLGEARFSGILTELARTLVEHRGELGDETRSACQLAALFELKTGHPDRCLLALDEAAKFPGPEWAPLVDGQRRAAAHRAAKNYRAEVATYRDLLKLKPENRSYMAGLAKALESAGDKAGAATARANVDPGAGLIGKAAPDFSVTRANGEGTLSLKEALAGKKALLVNFWFVGCQPCRLELPHLQTLMEEHRETLGIVCINQGDAPEDIHGFIKKTNLTLPFALGKDEAGKASPVFKAFHVDAYPTNFLISGAGKILWRGTGFGASSLRELKAALSEAGIG
jgi:peroxiredoxin